MRLKAAIQALQPHLDDALVVHANGYISRTSFGVQDRPSNFYMIGSMGLASSIGLGVALSRPDRQVVIFDGDGNLLMNLGSTAMIAACGPRRFVHVVFDNGVYASTGNQATISQQVRLDRIAAAAGYRQSSCVDDEAALVAAFQTCLATDGPTFVLARIEVETGHSTGARVTHTPQALRDRFAAAIVASAATRAAGRETR